MDLSFEVLEHVMSFLPYDDKKSARLVCRKWRDVSYSPRLLQNEVVKLQRYQDLNQLIGHGRKYFNVEIVSEAEEGTAIDFWSRCGKYVKYLKMYFRSRCFSEVFPNTPNLEELELWRWNWKHADIQTPRPALSFQNLRGVSLNFTNLSGGEFLMLLENAPRLEDLTLILADGRCAMGPGLVDALETFFNKQRNIIRRLHIPGCEFEDSELAKIFSNICPQMVELRLSESDTLTDECLPIIQTKMPNLRKIALNLSRYDEDGFYIMLVTEEGVHNLLRSLKQLTHIGLPMSLVGECTAQLLSTMDHLYSVDLVDASDDFDQRCLRKHSALSLFRN